MPGVRWLVDGMNVVGSRPEDRWWLDRQEAMRALAEQLRAYAARTGEEVTVVFDGEPFEALHPGAPGVVFAGGPGPGAADDEIARRVAGDADPQSLRVVTSDRELARRVRGVEVVGGGSFRERLDRLAPRA
jgi:predicted RNA-binding protein with PIN domain